MYMCDYTALLKKYLTSTLNYLKCYGIFQILAIIIAICILCCTDIKMKNADLIAPS